MERNPDQTRPGKVRYCWHCGANMGFIENRHYDRIDTCGSRECERAAGDAFAEEREEAHRQVDDHYNGGW